MVEDRRDCTWYFPPHVLSAKCIARDTNSVRSDDSQRSTYNVIVDQMSRPGVEAMTS